MSCTFDFVDNLSTEERGDKPHFTAQEKAHFKQAMKGNLACFQQGGKTCNVKPGELIDDLKNGCEVAVIGHDYTWHTHPCGLTPSPADVQTTKQLNRRFLCIGHSPTGKTTCYDLSNGGRVASKF